MTSPLLLTILVTMLTSNPPPSPEFGAEAATRFAELALSCVHREYPNKIAHVMAGDADARPPRELTPAFYGCYDWHSAVRYLSAPGRVSFERPYGLAWLLQLAAELREWDDPQAREWAAALKPLETRAADRLREATAKLHREAGLRAVTGAHYEGGHWLGSFAVYLVTGRGLKKP